MKVEPVRYHYDTEKYPYIGLDENRLTYGFIAQDLEIVVPDMVNDKNMDVISSKTATLDFNQERDMEQFKVINYILMISILNQAIRK